jgi:cell division control protein 6
LNFRDILAEKSVFLNKDALSPHFLPEKIVHREKEIEKIMRAVTPVFKAKRPNNVFLYGKSGTGKTASIKHIIKQFNELPSNGAINYVNCRMYNTRYKILQKIAADITGFSKNGFAPSVFYEKTLDWVENGNRFLIIVLDEIDVIKDLNELIYTLTRANDDLKHGGVSLIGISNKISFKNQLDTKCKSALLQTEVVFPPYNSDQLCEILAQRVSIGFNEGVCDHSAISLAAAVAARETGDARYALKLLMYAGEIADEHKDGAVTYKHVESARKTVERDLVSEAVATLPEHQQLVLYALALLTLKGSRYQRLGDDHNNMFMTGELYETYQTICKDSQKEKRSSRWCKEYLRELEALGLVETIESGKGIRGHSTLTRLLYSPEWIKKTVEAMALQSD